MSYETSDAVETQGSNQTGKSRKRSAGDALTRRSATGPRTTRGKMRSRYNAFKHGIFACGLAARESWDEYNALVADFIEHFHPVGRVEEILVEKAAMTIWRLRRLFRAEAGEIDSQVRAAKEDKNERDMIASLLGSGSLGLVRDALLTRNSVKLHQAVSRLKELGDKVRQDGLNWERDRGTLILLCGAPQGEDNSSTTQDREEEAEPHEQVPDAPLARHYWELVSDQDKVPAGKTDLLQTINKQIDLFEKEWERWFDQDIVTGSINRQRALVPKKEAAELLQRYEAALERSFERTLNQLERLQRIRLGQPVAPPLKVEVSRS